MDRSSDWPEVAAWRRAERKRLIAERLLVPADQRGALGRTIIAGLDSVSVPPHAVVGFYWPFRGEFDLRGWAASLIDREIRPALPVVIEKNRPMIFRLWRPDCRMERGIWNIPVPADGEPVVPDMVIAPLVGHDPRCYRLGYGGGYFDRTLAALSPKPLAVGVGLASAGLPSIRPQPHDIPMDRIITDKSTVVR